MIYWYTGQPGHGKTLHAIQRLLEFKDQGRIVYACNVRKFDYEKTGVLPMTPEQFRDWMNFLPDGAVALVDEAYEHGMLPKRPPGSAVPPHVQELAKHRHRGLDFIFVSQSPDKQCDQFVHDLIERHVHVRRMFGTGVVQLRQFDRFEANAEKATPIATSRGRLLANKKALGTYQSTEMDTTERRIPWYYWALGIGGPLGALFIWWVFGNMADRLTGGPLPEAEAAQVSPARGRSGEANGASATVAEAATMSPDDYVQRFRPRVPSQPWSAPAYDSALSLSSDPPRLFCMSGKPGENALGEWRENSQCICLTEQGTRYKLEHQQCAMIAQVGQYEPFYRTRDDARHADGYRQQEVLRDEQRIREMSASSSGMAGTGSLPTVPAEFGTITRPTP